MDWKRELKDQIGVVDEGTVASLNDMNGREFLTIRHLKQLEANRCDSGIGANADVASDESGI